MKAQEIFPDLQLKYSRWSLENALSSRAELSAEKAAKDWLESYLSDGLRDDEAVIEKTIRKLKNHGDEAGIKKAIRKLINHGNTGNNYAKNDEAEFIGMVEVDGEEFAHYKNVNFLA